MSPTRNSLTVKRKLFSYPHALSIMQRQRAVRGDLRVIAMDDAFFIFWLVAKRGVECNAAGCLFGIEPACVTRYFISITSTRQEFIKREFP